METIQIEQLSTRFQKAGFELFTEHFGVPVIPGMDKDTIYVDILLPSGMLKFFIRLDADVDPYMMNIVAYNLLFNRRLEIADLEIGGINLKELEAQIAELDYAIDPYSTAFVNKTQFIQDKLNALGQLERKNGRVQYEILLTKYWNRFDFGPKEEVVKIRHRVINQQSILKRIPIDPLKTTTPWQAYETYVHKSGRRRPKGGQNSKI
ncbi:hypothetical protein [Chitinophaga rhizophila]|uniref:Uncharacterized protein n=1 Tax=Chitinophaga rhizophila TaxID=2866212 RepID=A0ABS7G707_9BACT|nr:hypothetical protein [Chitinophaga rhizophila]MBW8683437.1 hypothetical protein [Chitinophaga rhizophila]